MLFEIKLRVLLKIRSFFAPNHIYDQNTLDAQSELDNEWQIGKIDKKHIRYTSNVVKQKPNRSGVRKANGSRANIPLFSYVADRNCYRNADHWEDASKEIASVEDDASSVDGNWDGKLVYVPIKNFKIDDEDFDLDCFSSELGLLNSAIIFSASFVSISFDERLIFDFGELQGS